MSNAKGAVLKRSVKLLGRNTSVSLEEPFWRALRAIAKRRQMSSAALIEAINADRREANLSSATRVYVLEYYQ